MRPDQDYFEETRLGKPYDLKLLRRLRPFTRPHRRLIVWSVGLVVLITLLDLSLPYVTKLAIDRYIVPPAASAPDSPPGSLMDISMPDLNGIETTRMIWAQTPQLKIIILSMLSTPEHSFRALEAGACGYLLKESAGREVADAVRSVFAGDIYLSQPVIKTLVADYIEHRQRAHSRSPLESLSQREREILPLVVEGKTSAEIAQNLYLSPKTVESYRSRMIHKLGLPDTASLIRWAVKEGLKD